MWIGARELHIDLLKLSYEVQLALVLISYCAAVIWARHYLQLSTALSKRKNSQHLVFVPDKKGSRLAFLALHQDF